MLTPADEVATGLLPPRSSRSRLGCLPLFRSPSRGDSGDEVPAISTLRLALVGRLLKKPKSCFTRARWTPPPDPAREKKAWWLVHNFSTQVCACAPLRFKQASSMEEERSRFLCDSSLHVVAVFVSILPLLHWSLRRHCSCFLLADVTEDTGVLEGPFPFERQKTFAFR